MLEAPNRIIFECARCEAKINAEYVAGYEASEAEGPFSSCFYFCRCPSCDEPYVAISYIDYSEKEAKWSTPELYLPRPEEGLGGFPKNVAASYGEARQCFRAKAYTAAAVMCRKTVEGICSEHGVTESNLEKSLRKMRDSGIIDSRLFEWADELRLSGNEAAHGVDLTFSRQDAQDILDFTRALLEYVFAFKDRFDSFRKRRKKGAGTTSASG